MNLKHAIFGEKSLTKVAAVFDSRNAAQDAALRLKQVGLSESQVSLVGPNDVAGPSGAPFSRKVEPESTGILLTLIRAHVFTGTLGAIAGLLLYVALVVAGVDAILSTPWMSLWIMLTFGTVFGLLAGGLLSLRPDHYRVISSVRRAIARGRWAVVGHPVGPRQVEVALTELRNRSDHVVRSF